jgi:hypothetical protein
MSTFAAVCSGCYKKWTDPRYRTCNKCRTKGLARYQNRKQLDIRNDTDISENTVPSNPPPDFDPFQNSISPGYLAALRERGGPSISANPLPNFEPNISNDTRIHKNTFPSNPPPNFNQFQNSISLKPLVSLRDRGRPSSSGGTRASAPSSTN